MWYIPVLAMAPRFCTAQITVPGRVYSAWSVFNKTSEAKQLAQNVEIEITEAHVFAAGNVLVCVERRAGATGTVFKLC